MVKTFIIRNLLENEKSFVISGSVETYEIRKRDLHSITLGIGDSVTVIEHPNFPRIVAGFDLDGHRVFRKSREEVIDEYLKNEEKRMYDKLPTIAKERVKMFSMFVEDFVSCDFLYEVVALSLGYELYSNCKSKEKIETFGNLSYADQVMLLPRFGSSLLPQIPAEKVVEFAMAYLHDSEASLLDDDDKDKLVYSEVMLLPNVSSDSHGKLCEPRLLYITKYVIATA